MDGQSSGIRKAEIEADCVDALRLCGYEITQLHAHQVDAIALLLAGRQVIQHIQTGGGKTMVIVLMVLLHKYFPRKYNGPLSTLVFTPTRLLLEDTKRRMESFRIKCWTSCESDADALFDISQHDVCVIPQADPNTLRTVNEADMLITTIEAWDMNSPQLYAARETFIDAKNQLIWMDEGDAVMSSAANFRPQQAKLGNIPKVFPDASLLLSSATWTTRLLDESVTFFNLKEPCIVRGPVDRTNLHVRGLNAFTFKEAKAAVLKILEDFVKSVARDPQNNKDQVMIFVRSHHDLDGMLKFLRKKVAKGLASKIISELHANLDDEEKKKVLNRIESGVTRIVVCTLKSAGAGLDFPNIRKNFFLTIPDCIEEFWQAMGRAGRDGKDADIYLFTSLHCMCKALAESRVPHCTRIILRSFGNSVSCRLTEILSYISGTDSIIQCGHCDLCSNHKSNQRSEAASTNINDGLLAYVWEGDEQERAFKCLKESFEEPAIRAELELGGLSVRSAENSPSQLLISVSSDDPTQIRLTSSIQAQMNIPQTNPVSGEKRKLGLL